MPVLKLKIDIGGTRDDEAWRAMQHFGEIQGAFFGAEFGTSGACKHPPDQHHTKGEWRGAEVLLANRLMAQYAMSHYLEQDRVLDADIEE